MHLKASSLNLLFAGIVLLGGTPDALAQVPTTQRIESNNFRPGQAAKLVAHGKGFKDVLYLWTPVGQLPYKPAEGKPSETVANFEGILPETTVPGVYETRVVTTHGVSARQFLVVDDLPSFALPDASEVNPPTTKLPVDCCVNGYINAVKPKFFGLDLKKDQQVSIEVFARQLDSLLDPVLRFSDADGNEIAFADDTPGLAGDAQLNITVPDDGTYVLELRDVKYGGGGSHFYHLRVGGFPLVQGLFPGRTSSGATANFVSSAAEELPATTASASATQLITLLSFPTEHGSAIGSVAVAPEAPVVEQEPNDTRESATVVNNTTTAVAGRMQAQGDVDWYKITADAKQHLCVTAHTRDVGSPADLVIEILDAAGKKLQESDDAAGHDAQLALQLPAAGDYFMAVRELSGQAGPAWTYDLEIQRGGRLEITTAVDTVAVPKGGKVAVPVAVKRLGMTATFEIEAANLPTGIVSTPVIVSAKQKTAIITLHSTGETADTFQHRMSLQANVDGSEATLPVLYVAPPPANKADPNYKLPRLLTGAFAYATAAAEFSLSADPALVMIPKAGESKTTITAVRTGDWNQPIELASAIPAAELPDGITVDAAKIEKDAVEITIKAGEAAKPGRYSISLQGTLKKDKTTIIQPVNTITIEVTEVAKAAE